MSGATLDAEEAFWATFCRDRLAPIFVKSLLCPLYHILIVEYRNKTTGLYPTIEAALELITDGKSHLCSHKGIHSPLGLADTEGEKVEKWADLESKSCLALQTHEKHLFMGCAFGTSDDRAPFHLLPNSDKDSLIDLLLGSLPVNPITPKKDGEMQCALYSFQYKEQLVIQDRICCWGAECVTIYYDQPGSNPWPVIRHVVPPAWVGFECKPTEVKRIKLRYKSNSRLANKQYELDAPDEGPDYELLALLALVGILFALAVVVVFAGFLLWFWASTL
ncbi:unnamed protein product, partial [Mesorhabditis spiculigera]